VTYEIVLNFTKISLVVHLTLRLATISLFVNHQNIAFDIACAKYLDISNLINFCCRTICSHNNPMHQSVKKKKKKLLGII